MKKTLLTFILFAFSFGMLTAQTVELKTETDSSSYALGLSLGSYIDQAKNDGGDAVDFNMDAVLRGVTDGANDKAILDEAQMRDAMRSLQMKMQNAKQEKEMAAAKENIVAGQKFLNENKAKKGVTTTASGLQYLVLKEGTGASPVATDKVNVHYHGTLIDGSIFDSSVDRGEPISFPLNGVIKGWTEGLQTMKIGGKTRFFIPADLAYGERGRPGIPGNSVLIFDVELLDIE